MQDSGWELQAAMLVQEVLTAVSAGESPTASTCSNALEPILAPLKILSEMHLARSVLAAALCQVLGFHAVLLTDPPR